MSVVGASADEDGAGRQSVGEPSLRNDDIVLELDSKVAPWAREKASTTWSQFSSRTSGGAPDSKRCCCGTASAGSMLDIAYRLRYIIILMWLSVLQYGSIAPSLVYISTSFFAGPGSDCEEDPSTELCKQGAAELAYWKGILSGLSQAFAWIFALTLGSFSDSVGRRPLFRAKTFLSIAPIAALAFHEFAGLTLWVYFLLDAAYNAFDTNGVFLAFMSDVITEPQQRAVAYAVIIVSFVVGAAPVLAVALLPAKIAVMVSALTALVKVMYVEAMFPETCRAVAENSPRRFSLLATAKEAMRLFWRHSFIFRMALILVLSGISSAGLGTVVTPIMTGYFGLKKDMSTFLAAVAGVSAFTNMVVVLRPLMRRCGDVNALRMCLGASAVFPVLFAMCTEVWHLALLFFLLIGPIILQFPIISAIKSNMVGDDEQGLVQGALAAIRVAAVAIADIFFGWFYRWSTDSGVAPRESTYPPLFTTSALAFAAFFIGCSLSSTPPPPPQKSCRPGPPDEEGGAPPEVRSAEAR